MNKWTPTTNLLILRRMGKLGEELGELQAVAARVIIQGLDETDPASGRTNRDRLEMEIADVRAQLECTIEAFGLDRDRIDLRDQHKRDLMGEWEAMF